MTHAMAFRPQQRSLMNYLPWALLLLSCSYMVMRWLMLPLNADELEFYRATLWVGEGRVPFRDFWEHHLPLQWILFAPFTRLIRNVGVHGVLALRAMDMVVVAGILVVLAAFMKRLKVPSVVGLLVIAALVGSPLFGTPLSEYRVDNPMNLFFLLGLLLLERSSSALQSRAMIVAAGVSLALSGLCSQRIIPLVGVTVLVYFVLGDGEGWAGRKKYLWTLIGGLGVVVLALLIAWMLGALGPMIKQCVADNWIYESNFHPTHVPSFWFHLIPYPFKSRDLMIPLLLAGGCAGSALAFTKGNHERGAQRLAALALSDGFVLATLSMPNLYQEMTLFLLLAPLAGYCLSKIMGARPTLGQRIPLYGSLLLIGLIYMANRRIPWGFDADVLAHQDHLIQVVSRVTNPGERVLEGEGFAYERPPAYYFWFLTSIAQVLTERGRYSALTVEDLVKARPAAVIMDSHLMSYLNVNPPEVAEFIVRNYLPLETSLWIPAPNGLVMPHGPPISWTIIRSGRYRPILVSPEKASLWLRAPFAVAMAEDLNVRLHTEKFARIELNIPALAGATDLSRLAFEVSGVPLHVGSDGLLTLAAGQRLAVQYSGVKASMLLMVPSQEQKLFQVPFHWTPLEFPRDFWAGFMGEDTGAVLSHGG